MARPGPHRRHPARRRVSDTDIVRGLAGRRRCVLSGGALGSSRRARVRSGESFLSTQMIDANGGPRLNRRHLARQACQGHRHHPRRRRGGVLSGRVERGAVQGGWARSRMVSVLIMKWSRTGRTRSALRACLSCSGLVTRHERRTRATQHRNAASLPFASAERQGVAVGLK